MQSQGRKGNFETERTMTVAEVSAYLSLSASSVYRLANDLRALRVGGRWAFRASDVEQWLMKRRTGMSVSSNLWRSWVLGPSFFSHG